MHVFISLHGLYCTSLRDFLPLRGEKTFCPYFRKAVDGRWLVSASGVFATRKRVQKIILWQPRLPFPLQITPLCLPFLLCMYIPSWGLNTLHHVSIPFCVYSIVHSIVCTLHYTSTPYCVHFIMYSLHSLSNLLCIHSIVCPFHCVSTPSCIYSIVSTPSYIRSIVSLLHRVFLDCMSTSSYVYSIVCLLRCVSSLLCVHLIVCPIHYASTPLYIHSTVCLLYLVSTTSHVHSIMCLLNCVFNRLFIHLIRASIVVQDTPYDIATFYIFYESFYARNHAWHALMHEFSQPAFQINQNITWLVISAQRYQGAGWNVIPARIYWRARWYTGHLGTEVLRGQDETSSWHGVIKGQDDTSIILARRYQRARWYIGHLGMEVSKDKVTSIIVARRYLGARWDIGHIGTGASGRRDSNHLSKGTRPQSSRHGFIRREKRPRQNRRTSGKVEAINASNSPSLQFSHHQYSPLVFSLQILPLPSNTTFACIQASFLSSPTVPVLRFHIPR